MKKNQLAIMIMKGILFIKKVRSFLGLGEAAKQSGFF